MNKTAAALMFVASADHLYDENYTWAIATAVVGLVNVVLSLWPREVLTIERILFGATALAGAAAAGFQLAYGDLPSAALAAAGSAVCVTGVLCE